LSGSADAIPGRASNTADANAQETIRIIASSNPRYPLRTTASPNPTTRANVPNIKSKIGGGSRDIAAAILFRSMPERPPLFR
jgi:hypothetical protein